jgi:hypothetical protein
MNRSTLSSPARGVPQSKNRISIPISKAIDGFLKFKTAYPVLFHLVRVRVDSKFSDLSLK